jgi:hypothetical protein
MGKNSISWRIIGNQFLVKPERFLLENSRFIARYLVVFGMISCHCSTMSTSAANMWTKRGKAAINGTGGEKC